MKSVITSTRDTGSPSRSLIACRSAIVSVSECSLKRFLFLFLWCLKKQAGQVSCGNDERRKVAVWEERVLTGRTMAGEGPHLNSISGTAKVKAEKADWTTVHRKDDYQRQALMNGFSTIRQQTIFCFAVNGATGRVACV